VTHKKSQADGNKEDAGKEQAELKDYLEDLQRVQAEFDNFRKRSEKEKQLLHGFAVEEVLEGLLPVLDNFQKALESMTADVPAAFKDGVDLICRQLTEAFGKFGVTIIKTAGEKFDPKQHEAVGSEEAGEDHVILKEVRRGYAINGRVVRPAAVIISVVKNRENSLEDKEETQWEK
jgi:molecular chaperone GrpE